MINSWDVLEKTKDCKTVEDVEKLKEYCTYKLRSSTMEFETYDYVVAVLRGYKMCLMEQK